MERLSLLHLIFVVDFPEVFSCERFGATIHFICSRAACMVAFTLACFAYRFRIMVLTNLCIHVSCFEVILTGNSKCPS